MNRKKTPVLIILLSLLISYSCREREENFQKEITPKHSSPFVVIREETLHVEISNTEKKRAAGLMFRDKLAENRGMLFIFEQERPLMFWMKNTTIPLSIAFINSKGLIVDIQDMKPMTSDGYVSRFPGIYALEVNQGWFKKHSIRIGDTVSFHF